jgi:multiple sugar transport system permease protein
VREGGGAEALGSIALRRLTGADRAFVGGAVAIVIAIQAALVWLPALASVALSFTSWDGIGGVAAIRPVGLANYATLVADPRFASALLNNLLWLVAYLGVATPIGLLLAVAIDRPLRGARLYQAALYLPALLSLALVGFIWQLQYSPDQGLLDGLLGRSGATAGAVAPIDWIGDRLINRVAILVPAIWRHVGTVVVLYLAGLRTIDPAIRDAAAIDAASELQTLRSVLLPALRPVTTVVLAIGTIDALRAFDLAYVLNAGINGLELLATLITATVAGAATRVGFGSAMATVLIALSLPAILGFLAFRARGDDA